MPIEFKRRTLPTPRRLHVIRALLLSSLLCLIFYLSSKTQSSSTPPPPPSSVALPLPPFTLPNPKPLPPSNLAHLLSSCPPPSTTTFQDYLKDRIFIKKCVKEEGRLPWGEFACFAQCPLEEPELETAFRVHSAADHDPKELVGMCKNHVFQALIWIDFHKDEVRFLDCTKTRITGTLNFETSMRLLKTLMCLVKLPFERDVLFGFDTGDYAAPNQDAPRSPYQYMVPLPGVVRFVGSPSVPSLLFPTKSFIVGAAHCNLHMNTNWWVMCTSHEYARKKNPFESRLKPIMWRGRPTGIPWMNAPWYFQQRIMMVDRFSRLDGFDIGFVVPFPGRIKTTEEAETAESSSQQFTAVQRETRELEMAQRAMREEEIKKLWVIKNEIHKSFTPHYAHLIHIDGNTASWGLAHKLVSGGVVLWVESPYLYREHFYRLLEPWKHYIPVKPDLSDLGSARDWVFANPEKAKAIGEEAVKLILTRLRSQDLFCYVARLLFVLYESQTRGGPLTAEFLKTHLGEQLYSDWQVFPEDPRYDAKPTTVTTVKT